MGVLGGGAVHAAAGMAVWGERPGLAARIGTGLPAHVRPFLERYFDLEGLSLVDFPQIRAWQVFEEDGTRRELMRVDITQPFQDGPPPQSLPVSWQSAKGLYLVLDGHGMLRWRNNHRQPQLFWEPNQPYMVREHATEFKRLLPRAEMVSPNLLEARAVFGFLNPESLVSEMLANGAEIVALRMGEHGSLVATRTNSTPIHIPAVPVPHIKDVTGAGNAYCGAFLVGWIRTGDILQAGRWGAVAASFCIETTSTIDLARTNLSKERDVRLKWLESQAG
jgi:bifunctional ADP-heptose synthase (sugar kinase/adenylyltransferase)